MKKRLELTVFATNVDTRINDYDRKCVFNEVNAQKEAIVN